MSKITIKFSARYEKMPSSFDGTTTQLTAVELVNLEDLDPEFIEKDTAIVGGGHYKLPKRGKYMVLQLLTTKSGTRCIHVWQTIRRWTAEKEDYYRSHVGETMNIEIQGGNSA
jgi:hypothetical protein